MDTSSALPTQQQYDLIIIGGGPGGLSAALYGARGGLKTLVLDRGLLGGELNNTMEIENYPGVDHKTGPELAEMMAAHCKRFGAECKEITHIHSVDLLSSPKTIKTDNGDFTAKAVIIATGSTHKKLGAPGEKELAGRGVSYCAVCDGPFFRNKHVVVVGGGNSAVEEGNFLTKHAAKVTLIHRRDSLRAEKIVCERALNNPKMAFIWNSTVTEICGEGKVSAVKILNRESGEQSSLDCDGVFIYVGLEPNVALFASQVSLDEGNRILTNAKLETNLTGVYAIGDVRVTELRQAVTAAADGALAATKAIEYVESLSD